MGGASHMNYEDLVEYYMSLPYEIVVENDTDGFVLSMPELGRAAVNGSGDTYAEAKQELKTVQREVLTMMLQEGCSIPLPKRIDQRVLLSPTLSFA